MFLGSVFFMFVIGILTYGTFLWFSGVSRVYQGLSLFYFLILLVVWTQMNYLTAVKEYRKITIVFFVAIVIIIVSSIILRFIFKIEAIISLFTAVIIGYGMMAVWYFDILYRYFPEAKGSPLEFLCWFDKYPKLVGIGVFLTLGLFGHMIIVWASPLGKQIQGLFYGAFEYDIAALLSFFSILLTNIKFITSVEVRFYPYYRTYFQLFNGRGNIIDIDNTEKKMLEVLIDEIKYISIQQTISCFLFVIFVSLALKPLFTDEMLAIFRILTVGYAFYSIGNVVMLLSLYFADNNSAYNSTLLLAITTNGFTILQLFFPKEFYGFGFFIGSAIFCIVSFIQLNNYLEKIKVHVLAKQPIVVFEKKGVFAPIHFKTEHIFLKLQEYRISDYERRKNKVE